MQQHGRRRWGGSVRRSKTLRYRVSSTSGDMGLEPGGRLQKPAFRENQHHGGMGEGEGHEGHSVRRLARDRRSGRFTGGGTGTSKKVDGGRGKGASTKALA